MSVKKTKKSQALRDLKALVGNLSDRDVKIKKDFRLFEDFFQHFPIPVSMWSAAIDGTIITIKDKGFFCENPKKVKNLFECELLKDIVRYAHEAACSGQNTQKLLTKSRKSFFISVVPRFDDTDSIVGVSGIAWDATSNVDIINILSEIKDLTESNSVTLTEISLKAEEAIQKSRIIKLIKGA